MQPPTATIETTAAGLRQCIAETAWAMVAALREATDYAITAERARDLHESLTEVAADVLHDQLAYLQQCEDEAADMRRYAIADDINDLARDDRAAAE